jgi:RNA polymerase sigma factor (sigma-70 family)
MLAQLVERNYKNILPVAKRITGRDCYRQATALISETYLTVSEKNKEYKSDEHFVKSFSKTMYFLFKGKRSTYNKAEGLSKVHLEYDPGNEDWKEIEIILDGNEQTKDLVMNLSHLKTEDAIEYVKLMQFKEQLPPHEKEIFCLHFENRMSGREIARLMETETGFKMSYVRYNEMIKGIKNKLNG